MKERDVTTAIYSTSKHQQQITISQIEVPTKNDIIFVPTFVDLQTPIRKVIRALQWQRQLSDLVGSIISAAASR